MTPIATERSITDKPKLPGKLDELSSENVHMLLCSLRFSYQTSLEFDSRPGLKFLVQKVAQLNNAANLYKQAGASWSLIALTLFDLCAARLKVKKITSEEIKHCLDQQQKAKNTAKTGQFTGVQECQVSRDQDGDATAQPDLTATDDFFLDLHNLFLDICELYVDIVVDKDGHHSRLDAMSRQQLYFLTVEPDDFNDVFRKPSAGSRGGSVSSPPPTVDLSDDDEREMAEDGKTSKPFGFSDFKTARPMRSDSPMNVSDDSMPGDSQRKRRTTGSVTFTDRADSRGSMGDLETGDEEVFRVTTQQEFDSMMSEFRYRKGKRALPSSSSTRDLGSTGSAGGSAAATRRKNPFTAMSKSASIARISASKDADPEIAAQQRSSLMEDSEAQVTVWTELVQVSFFNLLL